MSQLTATGATISDKEYPLSVQEKLYAITVYNSILLGKKSRFPDKFFIGKLGESRAIILIRYLIDDVFKWGTEELPRNINMDVFRKAKLGTMMDVVFNKQTIKAIKIAYPERNYKPWEFKRALPASFWTQRNIKRAVKWLIEEKLNLKKDEIRSKVRKQIFISNGFSYLCKIYGGYRKLIDIAYPGLLDASTYEEACKVVSNLLNVHFNWNDKPLLKSVFEFFINNGLRPILTKYFDGSPSMALKAVCPMKYEKYAIPYVKIEKTYINADSMDEARKMVKHLIEEKLCFDDEKVKTKLNKTVFWNYGLYYVLHTWFEGDYRIAIMETYPGKFEKWEFKFNHTLETVCNAMKNLIENELKWDENDIYNNTSLKFFKKHGMDGKLLYFFDHSPIKAMVTLYPHLKLWKFKSRPLDYWNYDTACKAIKELMEEELQWSIDDIKTKLSWDIFNGTMLFLLRKYFDNNPCVAIASIYPDSIDIDELPRLGTSPSKYKIAKQQKTPAHTKVMSVEEAYEKFKQFVEEKLEWDDDDIKSKVRYSRFNGQKIKKLIDTFFNGSIRNAILTTYPGRFKEWEILYIDSFEEACSAIKSLIEEELKLNSDEMLTKLKVSTFKKHYLMPTLNKYFKGDIITVIEMLYPQHHKPWELKRLDNEFWTLEKTHEAIRWLIEEKLCMDIKKIKCPSKRVFKKYGLLDVLDIHFEGKVADAVRTVYPKEVKTSTTRISRTLTFNETCVAIKEMIENKLLLDFDEVPSVLRFEMFQTHNLKRELFRHFNGNIATAVMTVYPGKYNSWDFKGIYWTFERACQATKWLIEEKLRWSAKEIKNGINPSVFKAYGIETILYKFSLEAIVEKLYPGLLSEQDKEKLDNDIKIYLAEGKTI